MFVNTLSSTAVLFPPMAGSGDGRSQSSISSMSSSAFSSQHFTQSDTEAEEEKRFIRRRAQRKQHPQLPMTPSAVMLRRREFLPPLHFASCSTPRSSLEDLMLDQNTSVYFRPLRQPPRGGSRHPERREAEQRKQQQQLKALQQQQQLLISQAYGHAYSGVQQRPSRRITEGGKHSRAESGKNSHILRKPRHVHRHGSRRRQSSNNPLMAAFLYGDGEPEDGEARCSSPILLDFRVSTDSDGGGEDQMTPRVEPRKVTGPAKQQQNATPPSNYAQIKKGNKQPHSNLSPFRPLQIHPSREEMKKPPSTLSSGCSRRENSKIPATSGLGVPRAGNSDSGMEERCTLEEAAEASGDWDKKTQFENISDGEKIYENLPPAVLEAPAPPSRRPPPPWNNNNIHHGQQQTNVAVLPPLEDFPELYGRLVAVAFVDVRAKRTGGQQGSGRRRIRAAHQQLAELVGLRVDKSFDPTADSEAEFRRKSADFGSQLAQRLRRTEACSRKEFDWQVKKLQKILHELRTAKDGEVKYLAERTGGTLQKLFRRVISWK